MSLRLLRLLKDGHGTLNGVIEDALHLELVLVVGVPLGQVTELLGQVKTMRDVLRRHVVLGHLDAVVKITDLKGVEKKNVWKFIPRIKS